MLMKHEAMSAPEMKRDHCVQLILQHQCVSKDVPAQRAKLFICFYLVHKIFPSFSHKFVYIVNKSLTDIITPTTPVVATS